MLCCRKYEILVLHPTATTAINPGPNKRDGYGVNSRYDQGARKGCEILFLRPIDNRRPSKIILIRSAVEMPWIHFIRLTIDEIIRNSHRIPHIHKVSRGIIRDLQIPIHPQKSRQSPIHGIMKRNPINCNLPRTPQKELFTRGVGERECGAEIRRPMIWLSPSPDVNSTKGIPASDFPSDIKVVLAVTRGAFVNGLAPFSEVVGSDLGCFVDA